MDKRGKLWVEIKTM